MTLCGLSVCTHTKFLNAVPAENAGLKINLCGLRELCVLILERLMDRTCKLDRVLAVTVNTDGLGTDRNDLAGRRSYSLRFNHLNYLIDRLLHVSNQGAGLAAGRERAVGLICAIGEDLRRRLDTGCIRFRDEKTSGKAVKHQLSVKRADSFGDRCRHLTVLRRLVVH